MKVKKNKNIQTGPAISSQSGYSLAQHKPRKAREGLKYERIIFTREMKKTDINLTR